MKTPLYVGIILWITWIIWWLLWWRELFFFSSVLLVWFVTMSLTRHITSPFVVTYKNTWMSIITGLCLWYGLHALFSWNILLLWFLCISRVTYVRGIKWHFSDWFYWWKKQLSDQIIWLFISVCVSFFCIKSWLYNMPINLLFWLSVWLVCLLCYYIFLWYTIKMLTQNVSVLLVLSLWFMTLLYTIIHYFF